MCKINIHEKLEKKLESILEDPFVHEDDGPGTREVILMLAKQV